MYDIQVQIGVRVLIFFPLLVWLTIGYGSYYVDLMVPLYTWALNMALPDYSVVSLQQVNLNAESVVTATVLAIREQTVDTRRLPPGFTITASTLVAHALKHVVVVLLVILVWPNMSLLQRFCRFLFCMPFLIIVEIIDIPLVLASAVQDLVEAAVAPEMAASSWRISWVKVMDGGGRILISIIAGFSASILHERFLNRMRWRKCTQ